MNHHKKMLFLVLLVVGCSSTPPAKDVAVVEPVVKAKPRV